MSKNFALTIIGLLIAAVLIGGVVTVYSNRNEAATDDQTLTPQEIEAIQQKDQLEFIEQDINCDIDPEACQAQEEALYDLGTAQ
jgi:hypothetical protein